MMKQLLLAGMLTVGATACSSADSDPTHVAVTAYLKQHLDDPASYQPARWGRAVAFRQQRADTMLAAQKRLQWQPLARHVASAVDSAQNATRFRGTSEQFHVMTTGGRVAARRADSLLNIIEKLVASKDTTRLGTLLTHAYRAKNKLGATMLDSAQFVVYKNGKVQQL